MTTATKTIEEKMIEAGGNLWEKNGKKRIYFNGPNAVAKFFNCEIVKRQQNPSAGFDGIIIKQKSKSFYDCTEEVFYSDRGTIANAARKFGLDVERI